MPYFLLLILCARPFGSWCQLIHQSPWCLSCTCWRYPLDLTHFRYVSHHYDILTRLLCPQISFLWLCSLGRMLGFVHPVLCCLDLFVRGLVPILWWWVDCSIFRLLWFCHLFLTHFPNWYGSSCPSHARFNGSTRSGLFSSFLDPVVRVLAALIRLNYGCSNCIG